MKPGQPFNFLDVARAAMPLMDDAQRAEAEQLLQDLGNDSAEMSLPEFQDAAANAFEEDMRPIVVAVVAALKAEDLQALQGLQAMLPHLLEEVNRTPALADLLAHQLGKAVLEGFNTEAQPE